MSEYNKLINDINNGKLSPIYLIHGDESFFSDNLINAIINSSVKSDAVDFDLKKIYSLPKMNEKRKVLIQQGHLVNYGGEVEQAIKLSGASILKTGKKDVLKEIKKERRCLQLNYVTFETEWPVD